MRSEVRWHGRAAPHDWEFGASTESGEIAEMAGRSVKDGPKTAPSPKDLVAFGQAGCTGIDVVALLRKMREPLEDLRILTEVTLSESLPRVFESCRLIYEVTGAGLNPERVARAVELSLLKDCGVSAMIGRSGCRLEPVLRVNGREVSIWDPDGARSAELQAWWERVSSSCPRGVALVIGASRGIGRALVHQLSAMGYGVVTGSRSLSGGSRSEVEAPPLFLDIEHDLSREAFVERLTSSGLRPELVVFNAGVLDRAARTAAQVRESELRHVFQTNLFGPVEMCHLLLAHLAPNPTLLFISSHMGLPTREEFDFSSYRLSKCALTMFARELGRELRPEGVAVAALHPGSVATEMNPTGVLSVEQSAERILLLLEPGMRDRILEINGDLWIVSLQEHRIDPWEEKRR